MHTSKLTFFRVIARFALPLTIVAAFNTAAFAQPAKVSGNLVVNGRVLSQYAFSPDGRYAVFSADKEVRTVYSLYSVRLSDGAITKLSEDLRTATTISNSPLQFDFKISPDGTRVVFLAFEFRAPPLFPILELFSVPIEGGVVSRLSGAIQRVDVSSFKLTPDGVRVIFAADKNSDGFSELYSTPIAISSLINISGALPSTSSINDYQISANSTFVVFNVAGTASAPAELYSTTVAANPAVRLALTNGLVANGGIVEFRISPDSARAVFLADKDTDNVFELYSTPLNSNAPVKISGVLAANGDVSDFKISPDGSRVVFVADKDTDTMFELYSTPIADNSGAPIKLSGALVTGGNVSEFAISPDSQRVVFVADKDTDGTVELFSAHVADNSAAPVKLANVSIAGGRVADDFLISPDSQRVVYLAENDAAGVFDLYSTPLATSAPVKIASALSVGTYIRSHKISPDSQRVVFRATDSSEFDNRDDVLYSTRIADNTLAPINISQSSTATDGVPDFQINADGSRALFRSKRNVDTVLDLYRVQIGGNALTMDFDGDDRILAHTDLLMLIRRHLGASAGAVSAGAMSANATITNASTIQTRIDAVRNDLAGVNRPLDIDLNGSVGTATDMVMILRYALGLRGSAITQGAIGAPSTFPQRTDPTAIENHLRYLFTTYEVSGQG
jgi:Tol biopolymer transport system component